MMKIYTLNLTDYQDDDAAATLDDALEKAWFDMTSNTIYDGCIARQDDTFVANHDISKRNVLADVCKRHIQAWDGKEPALKDESGEGVARYCIHLENRWYLLSMECVGYDDSFTVYLCIIPPRVMASLPRNLLQAAPYQTLEQLLSDLTVDA